MDRRFDETLSDELRALLLAADFTGLADTATKPWDNLWGRRPSNLMPDVSGIPFRRDRRHAIRNITR